MGELTRRMNADGTPIDAVPLEPERLAGLIQLVDSGRISGPIAKEVFEKMYGSRLTAAEVVDREGLSRIDDEAAVAEAVRAVIDANAGPVAQYRAGKQQTFGFLVGQVMKAMKGKANPGLVNDLLRRTLDGH
jgi:aspartyl-tRNA(Asn)/glutamyl-tRNA(Gln) amidotransferase subunit B